MTKSYTHPRQNGKLPRFPKPDGSKYITGDAQDWTYKYTWEDLMVAQSIYEHEFTTQGMPTRKDIYIYGVLREMMGDIEFKFGEGYIEKADKEWNAYLAQFPDLIKNQN